MPGVDRWKRRALRRQSGLPVCSCACARITAAKRLASKLCCGRAPSGGRLSIRTTVDLIGATDLARWRMFEISSTPSASAPRELDSLDPSRPQESQSWRCFGEDLCTWWRAFLAVSFSEGLLFSQPVYHCGSVQSFGSPYFWHLFKAKFEVLSPPRRLPTS